MGRPRIAESSRRTHTYSVRVSGAEAMELRARAAVAGMRPAVYMRTVALGAVQSSPQPLPRINEAAWQKLARVGSNLNQFIKAIHVNKSGLSLQILESALVAVEATLKELVEVRALLLRKEIK